MANVKWSEFPDFDPDGGVVTYVGLQGGVNVALPGAGYFQIVPDYITANLVPDGDLATDPVDDGWTLGADSVWSAGQIVSTGDDDPWFEAPYEAVEGETYLVQFTQTVIEGDATAIFFDNQANYLVFPRPGTWSFVFTAIASGPDNIWFDFDQYDDPAATRTITNISMRRIDPLALAISVKDVTGNQLFAINYDGIAIGIGAGLADVGIDIQNVAIGQYAGASLTTGYGNSLIGANAGANVTSGHQNTLIGREAGFNIATGSNQVVIGAFAGFALTSGGGNSLVGTSAGGNTTSGQDNTFFGASTGFANTTGIRNTYLGTGAGSQATVGDYNVAIGYGAMIGLVTGSSNICIGQSTCGNLTSGEANVVVGNGAAGSLTEGSANICIGQNTANNLTTGEDNIVIGDTIGGPTTGSSNILIGSAAALPSVSTSNWWSIQDIIEGDSGVDGRVQLNRPLQLRTGDAPASAGSNGVAGTVVYDAGFIYVCVDTNTWKRVAITTWP